MNKIRASKFVEFSSSILAILTIALVVTVSSASAKSHEPNGSVAASQVVAHISFAGLSAVDMAMLKKVNDKYYLYVQHSKDQGISVVDVSNPAQPEVVRDAVTVYVHPAHVEAAAKVGLPLEPAIKRMISTLNVAFRSGFSIAPSKRA